MNDPENKLVNAQARFVHRAAAVLVLCNSLGCTTAAAQPAPNTAPNTATDTSTSPTTRDVEARPSASAISADSSLDDILDALDRRGQNLTSLSADVVMTDTDAALGSTSSRTGTFWLDQRDEGSSRVHILFSEREDDGKRTAEKIEYLLRDGKLTDRNYRRQIQVTRVILRPGERMNLLKLGEGPFPLPIGQKKEDVHRAFNAKKIDSTNDDPQGTVHVRLAPKEGTSMARKMKTIDVWVDVRTALPQRIETLDPNEQATHTTNLKNLKINEGVTADNFMLEKIDESKWQLTDEPFHDVEPKKEN